ncbi:hypothetical protein KKG72_06320 [bacterium]|nr:hypothetical protein [bacterium]MBU1993344.1 hypothetical protein [bacterium]
MLEKLFESLYLKVFVSIVVGRSSSVVYIELLDKKGVLERLEKSFETISLDSNMHSFIESYIKETPYYYIAILDTSVSQGAIPTCSSQEMSLYKEMSSLKHLCYGGKWAYYTSKFDLQTMQKNYAKVGIDFVFSPFVALAHFFKDKIDTHLAIFILIEDNYMSLSIFENSKLLYAQHLNMEPHKDSEEMTIENSMVDEVDLHLDIGIDLEDVDVDDDIGGLDDFGDIEDLDSIDEIDEFSETQDMEEELQQNEEEPDNKEISNFNEDYQRFLLVQSSINKFYKDKKFNSKFVESAYVADSVGVSSDFKRYLEEEMFLNVYIRHINLVVEVCELAKAELQ